MEKSEVSYNREVIQQGQTEQLRKLCEGVEELTGQAGVAGQAGQAAYDECLEMVRQKREAAETRLSEMQQEGPDEFYESSLGSQIALDELKEALCEAQEKFGIPRKGSREEPATSAQGA